MQRLLAVTDFSFRSRLAVRRAGLLARKSGAVLMLLHVVDDEQPAYLVELERREAAKSLDAQLNSVAELRGVWCRPVVAMGEAFDGILRSARARSADLIVMGSHRKQLLSEIFTGTTIERVIRTGSFPVLIVNTDVGQQYASVLAAVDMVEASAHAIRTGKDLGLFGDVHVTVVHAFSSWAKGKMFISDAPQEAIDERVADERRHASTELAAFLEANGLRDDRWSRRVEEGNPVEVISRIANETRADLAVLGTRGRSRIARLLLGSVAEEALNTLEVDILVVPPVR